MKGKNDEVHEQVPELQSLKYVPFILKRNVKIYLKHTRNEKDNTFYLQSKNIIPSRHEIVICEIPDAKKFYIILDMEFKGGELIQDRSSMEEEPFE